MGTLSIGEVIGSVSGQSPEPEQPSANEAAAAPAHATSPADAAEELTRELRVMAWRQTRLQAD